MGSRLFLRSKSFAGLLDLLRMKSKEPPTAEHMSILLGKLVLDRVFLLSKPLRKNSNLGRTKRAYEGSGR